jgi:hypothetical protein
MKHLIAPLLCLLVSTAQAASLCTLSDPLTIDDDGLVTLEQVANYDEGTYTMRITYTGGRSWIGIGINTDGDSGMTPATAVIGRALEGVDDGATSVLKYQLVSDSEGGSGVIVRNEMFQTLSDVSFEQTEDESVLQFTQYLEESDQVVSDDSVWIFAVGLDDNQWEGKHAIYGSFNLRLTDDCVAGPTGAPVASPTASPVASDIFDNTQEEEDTTTVEEDTATVEDEETSTVEEPTTVVDPTEQDKDISSAESGFTSLDTSPPDRWMWVAHGFCLAIGWGVCAPLAIGAPLLRNLSFLKDGRWYTIHFYGNMLTAILTIAGFLLAVVATTRAGDKHFSQDVHHRAGFAILFIVLFQVGAACLRPDATTSTNINKNDHEKGDAFQDEDEEQEQPDHKQSETNYSDSDGESTEVKLDSTKNNETTKPLLRVAWDVMHRLVGALVLGLAWYNCHSGIALQVENYGEGDDLTSAFWTVTAGISGTIFVLAYGLRV